MEERDDCPSVRQLLACPNGCHWLLDSMPNGVYTVGLDGRITYWNKAAERIIGYTADEVIGKHCTFLEGNNCTGPSPDGLQRCQVFTDGEVVNRECRIRTKDGRRVDLLKNARVLKDSSGTVIGAVENVADITSLRAAQNEITHLRSQLEGRQRLGQIIGKSHQMQETFDLIKLVADSHASVLILGESGTGKELVARAVHAEGPRRDKPFVKVNCSALAETLLESELFGHVRGAFTGAIADKVGRVEAANGGTIFLDEIGDISPVVQLKLLRVVEEKRFERVGESSVRTTDVRIITATNRDLAALVKQGTFREDLYYRLKVAVIGMPALRERKEDIPLLVDHFVERFRRETGKPIEGCGADATVALLDYEWPGNVRELENAIEHAFVTCQGNLISIFDLPRELRQSRFERRALGERAARGHQADSREGVLNALREAQWNRARAARHLGISRTTLWKKIREFNIQQE